MEIKIGDRIIGYHEKEYKRFLLIETQEHKHILLEICQSSHDIDNPEEIIELFDCSSYPPMHAVMSKIIKTGEETPGYFCIKDKDGKKGRPNILNLTTSEAQDLIKKGNSIRFNIDPMKIVMGE